MSGGGNHQYRPFGTKGLQHPRDFEHGGDATSLLSPRSQTGDDRHGVVVRFENHPFVLQLRVGTGYFADDVDRHAVLPVHLSANRNFRPGGERLQLAPRRPVNKISRNVHRSTEVLRLCFSPQNGGGLDEDDRARAEDHRAEPRRSAVHVEQDDAPQYVFAVEGRQLALAAVDKVALDPRLWRLIRPHGIGPH